MPQSPAPGVKPPRAACNICGGRAFQPGPDGRLWKGIAPTCSRCGALERHRVYRAMLERLRTTDWSDFRALQFSIDPSIEADWFQSLDHSIYGQRNSLDIQDIALADGAYDVVICNHVVEHVEQDAKAVGELFRIVSPEGLLFVSVPIPAERSTTVDWGYPDASKHGHYRVYGYDLVARLPAMAPSAWISAVRDSDPVTGREDMGFIFAATSRWHRRALAANPRTELVHQPG